MSSKQAALLSHLATVAALLGSFTAYGAVCQRTTLDPIPFGPSFVGITMLISRRVGQG
jgi:hypothetical protein